MTEITKRDRKRAIDIAHHFDWELWSLPAYPEDIRVSVGVMEENVTFGKLADVEVCMRELGWLDKGAILPRPSTALAEVKYLLTLWDVFPFPRLIELMRAGLSMEAVVGLSRSGEDIDLDLMTAVDQGTR